MTLFYGDPGPCPVCDAPHHTCTGHGPAVRGPVLIEQLPASAALRLRTVPVPVPVSVPVPTPMAAPLVADRVQATLPPGEVTSGTYRGRAGRRRKV